MTHKVIRIQIVQTLLTNAFVKPEGGGLLKVSRSDAILSQIRSSQALAEKHNSTLIVFPELSLPDDARLRTDLCKWTERHNCVLIAGSYYKQTRKGRRPEYRPTSPVFVSGTAYEATKLELSPLEKPANHRIRVYGGDDILVLEKTPAGTIAVAICSDAFTSRLQKTLEERKVDVLCVPSMQRRPQDHHHRSLAAMARHTPDGVYIAYANSIWATHSDGGSSLFANADRILKPAFEADGYATGIETEQILCIPNAGRNLIVEVDLDCKRPSQTRTIQDIPQIRTIAKDFSKVHPDNRYIHGSPSSHPLPIRIVCFDADGTLTTGLTFSWKLLWSESYGADGEVRRAALRDQYENAVRENPQNRRQAYIDWCNQCCEDFRLKGLTKKRVIALAKSTRPVANLKETLTYIKHTLRCRLVLISGGIDVFTMHALGGHIWNMFDERHTNIMTFSESDDGLIQNIRATDFDYEGKFEVITTEALKMGCSLSQVAFIGDEINDRFALRQLKLEGGMAIAFGMETSLSREEVTHHVASNDLKDLIPFLEKRSRKPVRRRPRDEPSPLALVQTAIEKWVNICEHEQGSFPQNHLLSRITHDRRHRKRVAETVGKVLGAIRNLPEHHDVLTHMATCAVYTHDLGLFLPIDGFFPDAATFNESTQAELRRLRHHSVAGHALLAAAVEEGLPPFLGHELSVIQRQFGSSVARQFQTALSQTLLLLSQLTWFHDANETDLIESSRGFEEACDACNYLRITPGTMQLLRAAIRVADRLDRSQHRLKKRSLAEKLCTGIALGQISDVPSVLLDSLPIADRTILPVEGRVLRVMNEKASFKKLEAQKIADELFDARVLSRTGTEAPWYIRFLSERHGVHVTSVENSPPIGAKKRNLNSKAAFRRYSSITDTTGPLTAVYREVLLCCGLNSWIRTMPLPSILCGGISGNALFHVSNQQREKCIVLDERQWGQSEEHGIRVVRTEQLVSEYAQHGGPLQRLKGLLTDEKGNDWDIFISFIDPLTRGKMAVLNCHVPIDVGWTQDQAWKYAIRVKADIFPFHDRLCKETSKQIADFHRSIINYGIELPAPGTSNWFEKARTLEDVDLVSVLIEAWPDANMHVVDNEKRLFQDMSSIIIRIGSKRILSRTLELLCKSFVGGSEVSVLVQSLKELPVASLEVSARFSSDDKESANAFNFLHNLLRGGELFESRVDLNRESSRIEVIRSFFNCLRGNGCNAYCKIEDSNECFTVKLEVFFLG